MPKLSYINLRSEILDDFFTEIINHAHRSRATYEEVVMGYLSYNYESGFSRLENIIIDFVLYVISGKHFVSESFIKSLERRIQENINNGEIINLLRKLTTEDKENLLHDMYLVGLISKGERDILAN